MDLGVPQAEMKNTQQVESAEEMGFQWSRVKSFLFRLLYVRVPEKGPVNYCPLKEGVSYHGLDLPSSTEKLTVVYSSVC